MRKLLFTPIAILLPLSISPCLVSCGDNESPRDKDTFYVGQMGHYEEDHVVYDYLYSNEINVERNKEYKCIINIRDFDGWETTTAVSIWPNSGGTQPSPAPSIEYLTVDGVEAKDPQQEGYPYLKYCSGEYIGWAQISNWEFTTETTIEATFVFDVPDKINIWFTNRVMED